MVVIVDLDDEVHDPHSDTNGFANLTQLRHSLNVGNATSSDDGDDARPNPNINGFSAILSCYPYAVSDVDIQTTRLTAH